VSSATCQYLDPLLADTLDYRLAFQPPGAISPCIDNGINSGCPADDFEGNPRPVDIPGVANYGASAFCDMGAYEVQP